VIRRHCAACGESAPPETGDVTDDRVDHTNGSFIAPGALGSGAQEGIADDVQGRNEPKRPLNQHPAAAEGELDLDLVAGIDQNHRRRANEPLC
jgi:hypothetical protein